MIKSLCVIFLLVGLASQQRITSHYILPARTTLNVYTTYSFLLQTDTEIPSNAKVALTFPSEFTSLTQVNRVRFSFDGVTLLNATWSFYLNTFTIPIGNLAIGNLTIIFDNVLNPKDIPTTSNSTTSSFFILQTLFQDVVVAANKEFGRTTFTPSPTITTGGTFANQLNTYIEQGSSWAFTFTPSKSYIATSSLRFMFPEGFVSNKVQCNVSGVVDPNMKTRVFPSQNIYDCLNLGRALSGTITVILSGLVNPNYQMTVSGIQVHILQPNNLVVQEIITSTSTVLIRNKPLNATLTYPNNYRNCSTTHIYQINFDTNLNVGDYVEFTYGGNWTLFTNTINVISGITSTPSNKASWMTSLSSGAASTLLRLTNFSLIAKSTQFTFYLPLMSPLSPSTYSLNIKAYRRNGKLAQSYSNTIIINQTTGYIQQMNLHPMQSPIKLPVGKTGPIEIVLFLRNDLPKTNVLTWGHIIIQITPNIPAPVLALNGVPKCYFYDNKPAANCTFNSSDPDKTVVTIFTPIDFNFQQSQVPLTITTQGYQLPQNQGITIDTLVKRYFFQIQFYSNLRPHPTPQQVLFDQWVADSIQISSVSCSSRNTNHYQYDHLKCSFTTPTQILNSDGHIHLFRVQFADYTGWSISMPANTITPDYPCLMYGVNVSSVPYVKCDYVTFTSGPHRSHLTSASYSYITFYGLGTIPGGSTINFEIPKMLRGYTGYSGNIKFSILEDTPGYTSPIVYLYTQTLNPANTNGGGSYTVTSQTPTIVQTNSVINKVTSITLSNYDLGGSNPDTIIFQVDKTGYPNIGRGSSIACGSNTCSKFDSPVQYFILYPSSNLGSTASLTFPNIVNPPYSGNFQFNTRIYSGGNTRKKGTFAVTVSPDTITTRSYSFHANQTIATLYPNSNHYYTITWTTVNPVLSLLGNSYIKVVINNVFTFSSSYCQLTTTGSAYDGRNIFCDLSAGGTIVYLKNLADLAAGTTFSLTVQMISTSVASTVSPTVSIYTYYGNTNLVDQALNVPFAITPLPNTNLTVFSTFTVPSASVSTRAITAGYFGHLLLKFQPQASLTVTNGSRIVITMATGFYPAGNVVNLPLSCQLNGAYFQCTYTLSPFTITLYKTNSTFNTGINTINITTIHQNANGIFYPSTQGRYLNTLQILNQTSMTSLQKVQQYIDILPPDIAYFNVTWANRDIGVFNIYTVQFMNGQTPIPAYNDGANAGRIYIGFPLINSNSGTVFASNLGFSGITEGSLLPCFFQTATGFVGPTSGKALQCKIRMSYTNNYNTWIEIINFAQIPAGGVLRVFIAKITNPSQQNLDINFALKVNSLSVTTNIQSPLYQTNYNMWIDMLASSITNRNEQNSSSPFFQAGANVGDLNQYFNITPYTGTSGFATNDWWIIDLDPQFPLSGNIFNCLKPYYQYCIIYPTINWLAVKIGNSTILPLQPFVSQIPTSISRVDTYFNCYTFLNGRWAETITYTVTAATRWLALRGLISNVTFKVVGSQNKLNINQKNVEVTVGFTVQHMVPIGGTIQIQFPNNATTVPAIKMHCRSVVTMGSALNGYNSGKGISNVEGEVGCTVQNSYSWIITGFDTLSAGSQVIIYGMIDFPTAAVNTLGMGYICTYSNQDNTNAFTTAKTIDYIYTNYPMLVQNYTWSADSNFAMQQTVPLRVNYVGEMKFILNLDSIFYGSSFTDGIIYLHLYRVSITGASGGFGGPFSELICSIVDPITLFKYGCKFVYSTGNSDYYRYYLRTYQNLPANTNLQFTLSTLKGYATEGLTFPTSVGVYKTEVQIDYCTSGCNKLRSQVQYIQAYGPNWATLNFNSTVTIPSENNFILVTVVPSSNIASTQQIVIEIPTVALDGSTTLFPADLGMGYSAYDSLIFDIYESTISSMTCNVYPGDPAVSQPTKIVCSNFGALTSSSTIKFGFWVVNPPSNIGMAIPVQVYAYDQGSATKFIWSIVEAGIRILPITTTPINDWGNFASSNAIRQIMGTSLSLTTRNTQQMVKNDWYILKFGFDLRQSANSNGSFNYNSGLGGSGDVIFMRNCQTILLRVGSTNLTIITPGSTSINARITSLIYNPPYQLTTQQATIYAYVVYNSNDGCERIYYRDFYPTLVPNQPTGSSFTITPIYATNQMGMADDWRIQFRMSTSGTNSSSLVKYISIQFPSSSTSDLQLMSRSCVQYITSTIQIANCVIDIDNRVIWITPVIKATYTDASTLILQTVGMAIKNPIYNVTNLNMFAIRYYTWPNGQSNPGITAGSDNWCFMKQDSSNIGSSILTYNSYGSYQPQHSYLYSPPELFVNQWEPADYFIGNGSYSASLSKSPFKFKLISPAAFSLLQGSNYHSISVDFGSVYSYPTLSQTVNDLNFYVPVCYLNGFSILSCSISGTVITMQFQQAVGNGETIAAQFSIINPRDSTDYGFTLSNTNNPTVTFTVRAYNYNSGVTYLLNPDHFHTFYGSTSTGATYPSFGIQGISFVVGTQVVGQLNYIQFTLTLTRTDINGFIIQIPVVNPDGTKIYNDPTLLGLQSGSAYPCSLGIYTPVYCYYQKGSANGFGSPTRIYVTGFATSSTTFNLRILFTNPDNTQVFPTFIWKAFTGSFSTPDLMGSKFAGSHTILDAFKVFPTTNYFTSAGTLTCYPNQALWQTSTYYDCYHSTSMNANTYAIMAWQLVDPTYGTIGDYTYNSVDYIYDIFYMYTAANKYFVYLVQKRTAGYSGSGSSYMRFGYLRMKHHLVTNFNFYLLTRPGTTVYTAIFDSSWITTHRAANGFNQISMNNIDIQAKMSGQYGWQFYSVNAGNVLSTYLSNQFDPSQKVIQVQFTSTSLPYSSLSSTSTDCLLESGLVGNDPLKPITCSVDRTNNKILFYNVFWFTNRILNFYFKATTNSDAYGHSVIIYTWANVQAFNDRNYMIFYSQTSNSITTDSIFYASYPGYSGRSIDGAVQNSYTSMDLGGSYASSTRILSSSNQVRTEGHARIQAVTSNSITAQVYGSPSSSLDRSPAFRVGFRFYTQRLTTTSCSSVSLTINGYPLSNWASDNSAISYTCGNGGSNSRKFFALVYMNRQPSTTTYPNQWPDYYLGTTYQFTFSFSSVGGDYSSIPNNLWASASWLWENSRWYYHDSYCGCGGTHCSSGYDRQYCCWYYQYYCTGYSCNYDVNCRNIQGWDYYTYTGTNNAQYYYPANSLASSISIQLTTDQYSTQGQFNFYINNIATSLSSTMISNTASSNTQLIVSFDTGSAQTGNNVFNSGFFPYTNSAQSAAYIECLCVSSTGTFTITYSTTYTAANCTRYIISGMNPFIAVRLNVNAGNSLRCFFPGFMNPTNGYGSYLSTSFFVSNTHHFKNQDLPFDHFSPYMTRYQTINLYTRTNYGLWTNQNSQFWTQYGKVDDSRSYYLNTYSSPNFESPLLYYSAYYPKPNQNACANGNYQACRTYSTFTNRRYFMVAHYSGNTQYMTFNYNALFPDSKDAASSFYKYYIGWTTGGFTYYYNVQSSTSNSGYLSPATPTYGVTVPIYGSYLRTYSSPYVVSVDLTGKTLYSNQRTVGPFIGSFIQVQASGFSAIYGCGAYLHYNSNQAFFNNALYCLVTSSDTVKIWSNSDIAFTGKLIVTLSTSSAPTSTTFYFTLYDKYISGSDYGISVYTSVTLSNNPTSVTILPSTNIQWRRQAYKQLRTDAAPLRLTVNNNFQYVSAYSMGAQSEDTSNSNTIIISLPVTVGVSTAYKCYAREYQATKYSLYTEYPISCAYYSQTQVSIRPIPSHTLNPAFYYDFIVYINAGSSSPFITANSNSNYHIQVWSCKAFSSPTVLFYDIIPYENYVNVYPITLNSIYILTREAAIVNSLYIDFSIGYATPTAYYFQFIFDSLDLNYFGISNGGSIPCFINGLSAYSGKANGVNCYGFSDGVNSTSPLIIRVVNFASFSANANIKIAFDNFNNPPLQTLFAVPINLIINFVDAGNQKVYRSYFPNIYYSDSINIQATGVNTASLSANNGYLGASTYMSWAFGWPYSSGSNVWDKLVMKINGGMTCCSPYSSLSTLTDNYGNTLNKLWVNTAANISVYTLLSRSSGVSTTIYINNVINPQPVSFATYQQGRSATFLWYSAYKTYTKYTLTQPSYSAYSLNSDFISYAPDIVTASYTPISSYYTNQYYPFCYQYRWDIGASSYNNRNLSHIILYFTGGVRWIDFAWFRYVPGVINPRGSPKVGYNPSNSMWYVNITGIKDSSFSSSNDWYLRVMLYPNNNNYISHTSNLYNYNGQLQFSQSSSATTPSSHRFTTSSNYGPPNAWTFQHQRYTKSYYQLQRTNLYATSGLTTSKLNFKFTSPYNISQVQSFSFISSSSSYPSPSTPSNGIYCIIQKTSTTYVAYGAGLYAPCTYSSGTYTVNVPVGGLAAGNEYLLTVIDRQQLTSSFNMPISPQRIQISLVYNNMLSIAYGDVYTLDFAGYMTTYSVDHSHLQSGLYDMLGFSFRPSFALSAASTSAPITESVLSFQVESKYYDPCLSIDTVLSPSNSPFYNGIYYSHYASIAVGNANTRRLCGMNSQQQNWAPAKLTITDYGALSSSSTYYFRFPLITLPSGTNVPLTYKVKLLYYANGLPYPTILSLFNFEAKDFSSPPTTDGIQSAYLSLSSNVVQNTMSMTFYYNSYTFGSSAQTLIKFRNNYYPALTSISTLVSLSSGYTYQYYPNINLCSFTGVSSNSIYLGTYPTSIEAQNFEIYWVYTFTGTARYSGWFSSSTTRAVYSINAASTWNSTTFTKATSLLSTNSMDLYTVSWSASYLTFPEGSYMIVTFQPQLNLIDEYCYSYSGFTQGVNTNSNLVCKRYSSNQIIISGYAALAASALLRISAYMYISDSLSINSTSGSNNNFASYATVSVYSSASNLIVSANTLSYTLVLSNIRGSNLIGLTGTMTNPYSPGQAFPLYITFRLTSNTLVAGDYLQVDFGNWILDVATTGTRIFKYQVSGNIYWVPVNGTKLSGNMFKVPVYSSSYPMNAGATITLWVDTFAPTTYYGAKVSASQWNSFKIYAYKSGSLVQQNVYKIWTQPFGHASFNVTPALTYVLASTLYEFTVTPNISANAGDTILIEFTTSDGLTTDNLFSSTLGATITPPYPGSFDCSQAYGASVISNSPISCSVYQGNNATNPPIPSTIAIPIKKAISANTYIRLNILGIVNPNTASYPIGVVFKFASTCSSSDSNNLCAYYKSATYLQFTNAPSAVGTVTTGGLTFTPNNVSATNTNHTVSAGYSIISGNWIKLQYYSQVPIPTVCKIESGAGECYSYPTNNIIMIKATAGQSGSYTYTLGKMTNPYQNTYGTSTFYTEIWNVNITARFYTNYQASTLVYDPTSSAPLSILFTPTLTPNYQLKYGFNNIARIQLTNLMQNRYVQMIYLSAPSEITIDGTYCNATLQTYPGEAKPYPYRFVCQTLSSNWIKLNLQSDFPAWTANFTGRSIYVYLRYTILNSQTTQSNLWTAQSYAHSSSIDQNYRIAQGTGRFSIKEYQLPYLYVISLFTRSFGQRTCTINQQCMFYGFLLPSTPSSSIPITSMTFLLPKEFNYSTTQTLNKCTLQPTTTMLYTFSCGVARNNSQITISYTPPAYNQGYNLINLDNSVASMLFTSPKYPGNQYQMQVNLWSNTNKLVQTQYINITTVYGFYLSVPLITFVIPNDGGAKGLFDLTFTVGSADILPSYTNSLSNSITSAIEISFAKTFDFDLGTGLSAGAQIACLNISGLTFNTMGRIKCQIYPSVSTITYPTIVITGYDRIYNNTVVRIQFANLKTLPTAITDYCKLGVSLTYYAYGGTKGYIYQPVSFVVGPPTAPISPKSITFTAVEVGSNTVGELTNYTLAGTFGSGFSTITSSDYIVIQFPQYTFEGRFNLNTQALCSLAASNKCSVFGLASQVYLQPSSSVSASSFSFTLNKILNAAFSIQYLNRTITLFTVVNNKINALGTTVLLKFTQASSNVSAIITAIDSIYGGDAGTNYYFSFQLNSYLPESGKIAVFFPTIYQSLFSVNSQCFLRQDSQLLVGSQAYCSIINSYQLVIVPNGVLLSSTQPYYFTVTNISNPNFNLSTYKFGIYTYYTNDVYQPLIISQSQFSSPIITPITVKVCNFALDISLANPQITSSYTMKITCPSTIKSASRLKVYLSWNPPLSNGTCYSQASTLFSQQCNIANQYSGTTKLTLLSVWLRSITAQKPFIITGQIPNGIQGTYTLNATISYNQFVYMTATSNSFYIFSANSGTTVAAVVSSNSNSITTSNGKSISIKTANYPYNKLFNAIYTFAFTAPQFSVPVSNLQIDLPSAITSSSSGITCNFNSFVPNDNYFNLMLLKDKNSLTCQMKGQKVIIYNLTSIISKLSSNDFLYLGINGLMNPQTSLSRTNFTFTFITNSTYVQSILQFTLPLSYTISSPPTDMQIGAISLSNNKFYVISQYTFTVSSVNGVTLYITASSQIGIMIDFPAEYSSIWSQIALPSSLNLTISGNNYTASNITMSTGYLYAVFSATAFTSQINFTTFNITFMFRNPNVSIDCTNSPVFTISLFDFKSRSIYAQSLSNNNVCPSLSVYLASINVNGNTKIPAGSSSQFIVSLEKAAQNLTIVPACTSSAISFSPATILFTNYSQLNQTFNITAANGLSGNFTITFTKIQNSTYTFYNDIQYLTLNVYVPTSQYYIKVVPFKVNSNGNPIVVTIQLEVGSPSSFALITSHNCSSYFNISPPLIPIPASAKEVNYSVTYTGTTVPKECYQSFKISSITENNYYLQNSIVYYSASASIDNSGLTPPMILQLTTVAQVSSNFGYTIASKNSTSTNSTSRQNLPKVYTLSSIRIGSNSASFIVATWPAGIVYYTVVPAGTPVSLVTTAGIYNKSLSSGITYGNGYSALETKGVNIVANLDVKGLRTQQNYTIAAYLNSTLGLSVILFSNFTTAKASNGAAIKIAMSSVINVTTYISALSQVLSIVTTRIYVLTPKQTLSAQQSSWQSSVMNSRYYIYETVIAPNPDDDSTSPLQLLGSFNSDTNAKKLLNSFISQYIPSFVSNIRQLFNTVPKIRNPIKIVAKSYNSVTFVISFWDKQFVYAQIVQKDNRTLLSRQIINGLNADNTKVISQHYTNITTDEYGQTTITFNLLKDNSSYTLHVTAQCPLPYSPRLALADSNVLRTNFETPINPNLMKNKGVAADAISKIDPDFGRKFQAQTKYNDNQNRINKVDKTKRERVHN